MTARQTETEYLLDVRGSVQVDAPGGRRLHLTAEGARLRLNVPGWQELTAMAPRSRKARRSTVRLLGEGLQRMGLILEIESAGRPVFNIGSGVEPSWLARILGLAPAHIPWSAIFTLWRRRGP